MTVNQLGKGRAYYIASRNKEPFHSDFYRKLVEQTGVLRALPVELPSGVSSSIRTDGESDYIFVMNFSGEAKRVTLDGTRYSDFISGEAIGAELVLAPYGVKVIIKGGIS